MGFKILVADDDFDNRTIATEILRASGYTVVQASNGLQAMEVALSEKPDVILLDLSMPKLDGWETTRRLKKIPEVARIPVIAFTAHAMVGDEKKAREAGCDDFLTKPCTPKQIIEKMKTWLGKRQASDGPGE